jgi:hypothetical protein
MAGPEWRRSVLQRVEWTRSPVQRLPSWRRLLTNRTPGARLQVFVRAVVSEPFLSTYNASGGAVVWGLPTSSPAADPHDPNFLYQRFQNGILFYDASAGTTQALPLGTDGSDGCVCA